MILFYFLIVFGNYNYMADFPTSVYAPRVKENRSGVVYDALAKQKNFAEDIIYLDNEVVAIEEYLDVDNSYVLKKAHVQLSSAQIKSLRASPITIIPAQGSNKIIQVISAFGINNFNTIAYSNAGYGLSVLLNNVEFINFDTYFVTGTSKIFCSNVPYTHEGTTDLINKSVILKNSGLSEYTNGDGTIDIYIQYVVIDVS